MIRQIRCLFVLCIAQALVFGQAVVPGKPGSRLRLAIAQSEFRVRAGESVDIEAPAEVKAFVFKSKSRTVRMAEGDSSGPRLAVGRTEDGTLFLAAPLTMPSGSYQATIAVEGENGEAREVVVAVTVDPLATVPLGYSQPPIILLNGWQRSGGLFFLDSCPVKRPVATFGSYYGTYLWAAPQVYWFDNCTQCPNCTIEKLGDSLAEVIKAIQYSSGAQVPQFDLVGHSMGGLIIRSYLAGLKEDGLPQPPVDVRVRKMVQIGTPNFGAFAAAKIPFAGKQTKELYPGSAFLWQLATWNQGRDDLRGVDALAIIGNKGAWPDTSGLSNASDGVVTLTSGSLDFAREEARTRVLRFCHSDLEFWESWPIPCDGLPIAQQPQTWAAISSFLSGSSTAWQVGSTAAAIAGRWGGVFLGIVGEDYFTQGYYRDLKQLSVGGINLPLGGDFYNSDFLSAGLSNGFLSSPSIPGPTPFFVSVPTSTFGAYRLKLGPYIRSVGPLIVSPALVVQSGGTIKIQGSGFGSRCNSCWVVAGSSQVLSILLWTDGEITATLPSQSGYLPITVTASGGRDRTYIMSAPGPVVRTFNSTPPGLNIQVDGTTRTTPFDLSLKTGATVAVSVPTPQTLGAGSRAIFANWTDGAAASRSIVVSSAPIATYSATFTTQHQLTRIVSPTGAGTVYVTTASSDGFYNQASTLQLIAAPNAGFQFSGFSGNLSGTTNPAALTIQGPSTVTANFICTYQLSAASASVVAAAGNGSFSASTGAGCPVAVISSGSWLGATANSGTISFNYQANSGAARSATLTVGGQIFTVTQVAAAGPTPTPSVQSTGPLSGAGNAQTLTFRFSHPQGFQQLGVVNVLINRALDGGNACYLAYSQSAKVLFLVNDGGPDAGLSAPLTLGTAGVIENGQCSISSSGSSATGNGNVLTLVLNITFKPKFGGNQVIYLAARDAANGNSGWHAMGVSMIPEALPTFPRSGGANAILGSQPNGLLSLTFSDVAASANLQTAWALVNSSIDARSACYVAYYAPANLLFLFPDNGDGAAVTSMELTGTNSIENSQCRISAQGSSAVRSGNQLLLNLNTSFKAGFGGARGIWSAVQTLASQTSAWKAVGNWQVP